MCGLATYNNKVYLLKQGSGKQDLLQLDMFTGKAQPWPNGDYLLTPRQKVAPLKNMLASAGGKIFLADSENNKIYISNADNPLFDISFPAESPDSLSGDDTTGLVWYISKGEVVQTINDKGNVINRGRPVAKPIALACRNKRLAIASAETGKVHVFDVSEPGKWKVLFTIGTGTDPIGLVAPDRFEFKISKYSDVAAVRTDLAVGPNGEIAVLHGRRVAMFDPKGQLIRDTWADFCWDMFPVNYSDAAPTGFYNGKGYSFSINALTKSWQPQAKWAVPTGCSLYRFFAFNGKKYALGTQLFPKWFTNGQNGTGFVICAIDEYVARPISQYMYDEKNRNWQIRRDANGDGTIDNNDSFSPWKTVDGRDMVLPTHFASYSYPSRDGSLKLLFQPDRPGIDLWPDGQTIRGVVIEITADANGIPQLVVENNNLPRMAQVTFPSPYSNSEEEDISYCAGGNGMLPASDGGWVFFPYLKSSPAMKGNIVNGSGSDLIGVTAGGNIRWFRSFNEAGPAIALSKINGLITVGGCWEAEIYTMTEDGLSTGNFGLPLAAHYRFGLMDHPNVLQPFIGNDGQQYYLMGEFMSNCANWFALRNSDTIRISTKPLRISNTTAETLRALPLKVISTSLPKPPTIMVNKLAKPLPVDGDLVKWRKAGITPQVLLTPDGAGGGVAGPADACGILRMAYEGDNLYFQVLVFDNQVVQYQPANKFYMQDAIEISLNGYAVGGFKYNLTRVRDEGEYLFRDRWFSEKLSRALDPVIAPRVVKILPDAENVEERLLIESIYGVNLTKSSVIIYECKLPVNEVYNKDQQFNKDLGLPEYPIQMKSASTFHFGIQIDDSDEPGADVQHFISWPSSYNTWAPAELHATAVFE